MFRTLISETALTTREANEFFGDKIFGDSAFDQDTSFVSTLRALMYSRIGPDDKIKFRYMNSNLPSNRIGRYSAETNMNSVFEGTAQVKDKITVVNFNHYDREENKKWLEFVEKKFTELNPGWVRVEKVTVLFQRVFKCLAYVNEDVKGAQLFVTGMNHKFFHFLQCAIPAVLPWYFDPKAVSQLDMDIIMSLKEKEPDKYLECCARVAAQYDMRSGMIHKLLDGFDKKFDTARLAQINQDIEGFDSNIRDHYEEIRQLLKSKEEKSIMALGLMAKIASDETGSEIADYFIANKRLSLRSADEDSIVFVVSDYLDFYDEDAARKFIENQRSVLYDINSTPEISREDMKLLLKSIFIDQKLRMRFCAAFSIELSGSVDTFKRFNYGITTCTPNPHMDRYHCLGNNGMLINELLQKHDYIAAVDQCIAATKSLNFCDAPVITEFAKRLYGISNFDVNVKCIELPDGKIVEPKEAIEWLKQDAAKEAPNAEEGHDE